MIPFRREPTGDARLDRIWNFLRDLVAALAFVPFLRGKRIDGVVLAGLGATVTVQHALGRRAAGYLVLRVYGATVGEIPIEGNAARDPTQAMILTSNAAMTLDLWVF